MESHKNALGYKQLIKIEFNSLAFYRDLLTEFIATFLLTMSSLTLGLSWGDKPNTGTVLQIGIGMMCTVTSLAWALGEFGGIHMNPVVTLSMTMLREMTITRGILYIILQCIAATMSSYYVKLIHPAWVTENLSPTQLHPDVAVWQALLTEIWLTGLLVLVVLGATNKGRKMAESVIVPPHIIAMIVCTCICSGINSTGCSMNPALTFGPAFATGIWNDHWVYWVGPMTGSALATLLYLGMDLVDNPEKQPNAKTGSYAVDRQVCVNEHDMSTQCESTSTNYLSTHPAGYAISIPPLTPTVTPVATPKTLRRRRFYSVSGDDSPLMTRPRAHTRGLYG